MLFALFSKKKKLFPTFQDTFLFCKFDVDIGHPLKYYAYLVGWWLYKYVYVLIRCWIHTWKSIIPIHSWFVFIKKSERMQQHHYVCGIYIEYICLRLFSNWYYICILYCFKISIKNWTQYFMLYNQLQQIGQNILVLYLLVIFV